MADPVRLPQPGSDQGSWGTLLNTFLGVEHNADGTLKKASLITGAQQTTAKDQPDGYAGLDNSGLLDSALLPAQGVGHYCGVSMSTTAIPTGAPLSLVFESQTAVLGSGVSWSSGSPGLITPASDGVYAISLTVHWQDSAASSGTLRYAQIASACGFHTEAQTSNTTSINTVQSVSLVATLRANQHVQAILQQQSGGDLTPTVLMLVTKVAPAVLPI